MAKVTVTLTDQENGTVRIDAEPSMPTLAAMHKAGDASPAQGYGLIALSEVIKTSIKEAQAKQKEKYKRERSQIILPDSPRYTH